MRRKKIICIVSLLLLIVLVAFIIDYINSRTLYKFEAEIKEQFDKVKGFEVSNYGPHCDILVYLDTDDYEYEDIEPIFIDIMLKLNEEAYFNYFEERHISKAASELAFLHIYFYNEDGKAENLLFKFNSYKDFEIWELDRDKSVTYNVSDYK